MPDCSIDLVNLFSPRRAVKDRDDLLQVHDIAGGGVVLLGEQEAIVLQLPVEFLFS